MSDHSNESRFPRAAVAVRMLLSLTIGSAFMIVVFWLILMAPVVLGATPLTGPEGMFGVLWRGVVIVLSGTALGLGAYWVGRSRMRRETACRTGVCTDMRVADACTKEISTATEEDGELVTQILRDWFEGGRQ